MHTIRRVDTIPWILTWEVRSARLWNTFFMHTNLNNTIIINENSWYDANTENKDDNGNHSNHQVKMFEALDVAIHYPTLHNNVSI